MKRMLMAVLLVSVLGAAPARAVEEFHVLLDPPSVSVSEGANVSVSLVVDASAHEFNGYEIILLYNPQVLQFIGVTEGSLMTGACPDRFRYLSTPSDSTVKYTHVILCQGVALNGPGVLSSYQFRAIASGTSGLTLVSDPDRSFYDAGFYIWPNHPTYPRQVTFSNSEVVVHGVASAPTEGSESASGVSIAIGPNPTVDASEIRLVIPAAQSWVLRLVDIAGREQARWQGETASREVTRLVLGRDTIGRRLTPGVYFLRLETPESVTAARWVLSR